MIRVTPAQRVIAEALIGGVISSILFGLALGLSFGDALLWGFIAACLRAAAGFVRLAQ